MSTQVESRRRSQDKRDRRRNKIVAFSLAGVVATAGIAGVVVTSSAYFTDIKEIGSNTVSVQGIDIEGYTRPASGSSAVIANFALDDLGPVLASDNAQFGSAPSKTFDVKNVSKTAFKYKVEITDIVLKRKDGTTDLPTSDDSTSTVNGALSAATIKGVVKMNMVRSAYNSSASFVPSYNAANGKTLATLDTTPTILSDVDASNSNAPYKLFANTVTDDTDKATLGIRVWIDEGSLKDTVNGTTTDWSQEKKNMLQNFKFTFKIKITATQL